MRIILFVVIVVMIVWLIRLQREAIEFREGRYFVLMEVSGAYSPMYVRHVRKDGSLSLSSDSPTKMAYRTALQIESLYPHLRIIDIRTNTLV